MRIRRRGPSSLVTPLYSLPLATDQADLSYLTHASPDAAAPPLPTGAATSPQDKEAMLQDLDLTKESRPPVVGGSPKTPCAPTPDSTSIQVMKDKEKEATGMVAATDFSKSAIGARNKRKARSGAEEKGNGMVEAMGHVDASSDDVGGDAAAPLLQEEKGAENAERARRLGDPPVPVEKRRCNRANGHGWRCRRDALPGYSLCDRHISNSRLLAIMAQEKDPDATTKSMPAVSKIAAAATSSAVGGQETGPSSQKPAVGEKRSKVSMPREPLMSSMINEESYVRVPSSPVGLEPSSK